MKYYHGSNRKLKPGEYLSGRWRGIPIIDEEFDRIRPRNQQSRFDALFMMSSLKSVELVADTEYIYEVMPAGAVKRHNLYWYQRGLELIHPYLTSGKRKISDDDRIKLHRFATKYWSGSPPPKSNSDHARERLWEYLAHSAIVIRVAR